MGKDRTGAVAAIRRQPWVSLFALALCLSAALLLTLRANIGFFLDDWALVIYREGSPTDWLLPHNEHIIVLPAAIYKLSLAVFGMTAFPLHLVALGLFLTSVVLLFLWMRPLVGDAASALGCIVLLFLGAAIEDLVWAFQMGFFGSAAGGLGAMLLIRRNALAADVYACLLLVVSLLFSTLAIPFIVGAAVQLAVRGDRVDLAAAARRSWVVLVPGLLYVVWWLGWGHLAANGMSLYNAVRDPLYALSALAYAVASLTGLFPVHELNESNLWAVPGLLVAGLIAFVLYRRKKIPPELLIALATAFSFWLLSGLNLIPGRDFHASRYQYPSVIFLLMILSGTFAGLRPGRRLVTVLSMLVLASLAVNVAALIYNFNHEYKGFEEKNLVSLTTFDISRDTVDPGFTVGISNDDRALVDAKSYLDVVDKYGSPALTDEQIEDASPDNRNRIDQLLVGAVGVRLVPASAVAPVLSNCRTVLARQEDSRGIPVPGPLLWIRSRNPDLVRLGRFGDDATAIAWATPAGQPTGYLIPRDRSDRPWHIGFEGTGPVKVCPAIPAG